MDFTSLGTAVLAFVVGTLLPSIYKLYTSVRTPEFVKAVDLVIGALDVSKKSFPGYFNDPEVLWDDYVLKVTTALKDEKAFVYDVTTVATAVLQKLDK